MGPNQVLCSQCGRSPAEGSANYVSRRRVADHLHLLSVLWIVIGLLCLIPVPILMVLSRVVGQIRATGMSPGDETMLHNIGPLFMMALATFCAAIAVGMLATGWGLLKREPWGRTLALVVGFLGLFHPPLGMALGVYTLWVLLPASAGVEYDHMVAEAAASCAVQTATS